MFQLFVLWAVVALLVSLAAGLPAGLDRVRRQDEEAGPNGCDPATGIGGFLLFPALRAWCEEQGVAEFGVFGR